jgi:hypothetical protein
MDRFVDESTQVIFEILSQQDKLIESDNQTALSFLQLEKLRPYEYPIGDIQ